MGQGVQKIVQEELENRKETKKVTCKQFLPFLVSQII